MIEIKLPYAPTLNCAPNAQGEDPNVLAKYLHYKRILHLPGGPM